MAVTKIDIYLKGMILTISIVLLSACATSISQIQEWERTGNIPKLSEVARDKTESPVIRKRSLESLARLNWHPSNDERLQVYSLFASQADYQEAATLMQALNAEAFTAIDEKVVACGSLLTRDGSWTDVRKARTMYYELRTLNKKAVTISLCQQVVARPQLQVQILLLAIKLGIEGGVRSAETLHFT